MIDVWINNGSGCNVEIIEPQYINICTSRPWGGGFCINLVVELRRPKKGIINIEKKDQKCFFWCHVRHINLSKNIQRELRKW